MKIDGSSQYGIENHAGTFTNASNMHIGSLSAVGISGIINNATFENLGDLMIDRCSSSGLLNSAGLFTNSRHLYVGFKAAVGENGIVNSASAQISNSELIAVNRSTISGIDNQGAFSNNDAMLYIYPDGNFGGTDGSNGIKNSGTFSNLGDGEIMIDRQTGYGIWNSSGTFTNETKVTIGAGTVFGTRCIYNESTFNNNAGGVIQAQKASTYGIEHVTGTFSNAGTINIGTIGFSIGTNGLRNSSTFNNNAGGEININCSTETGFLNGAGVFGNTGTINVGALATIGITGISNSATINNNPGGVININRATTQGINNVAGTFTNNASIEIGKTTPMPTLVNGTGGEFSNATDGILKGTGAINASFFTNAGCTLSPGHSPGVHTFSASEDFGNSTLLMEVTGAGGADFDQINVNGTANLSNTSTYLQLVFSYAVANGATIDLITATSITGTIAEGNISFTNIGAGNVTGFTVSYPSSNKLRVTINSPLPVSLISFNARAEGATRQLDWETSMELDNDYFEIQRSKDAKSFSAIGQVKGSNTGIKTNRYNYTDSDTISAGGIIYYRLKLVDLDGSYAYSRVQSIQTDQAIDVRIFPNPVSNILFVEVKSWENVREVALYNLNGRAVYNSAFSGLNKSIDVKRIMEGTYVVELLFKDGQSKTSRVAIVR